MDVSSQTAAFERLAVDYLRTEQQDMDHKTAKKLIEHLKKLDGPINEATLVAEDIDDLEERRRVRRGIAKVTAMVYVQLMLPICKEHPDLLPDQSEGGSES